MKKLLTLLLSAMFNLCIAQEKLPVFVTDSLDNYINRGMKQWSIPGVSVAIVKDRKTVFIKGYGLREVGKTDKVDANTLFMIGSNTKAFTATALAMLEASNKLSLNDPVQKWLPDFQLYDPWIAKQATITDLLCHRLGFETFQGDFMFFDTDLTTPEMMERFGKLKAMYGFRSKWGYTNAAFMVAGEILPKATGKSWADNIRENIFKPVGMSNSLALSDEILKAPNRASAHTTLGGPLRKIAYGHLDGLSPAGAISSSAADMAKWVTMLLDTGKIDGKVVIAKEAILRTREPQSLIGDGNGGHMFNKMHFDLYGLGWEMYEYEGREFVGHTGGVNGFVTSVALFPEDRLGIVVLTNTDSNGFFEALRNEIQDAFFGLPYRNYSSVFLGFNTSQKQRNETRIKQMQDSIAMKPKPSLSLQSFAGTYKHELYGNMTMTLKGDKLVATFEHHSGRYADIEPLGKNRFLATFNEALFGTKVWPFKIEDGKVKSVTVTVADFVEFTPYEFVKVK
jgi:CubicO group peptidase (beta-lactamase class C family)